MDANEPGIDLLLERACRGDAEARQGLLVACRDRLRRMVSVRLDRRVAARLDPSDVVQEALIDADARLDDFLRRRPLPFYPWLRQIAWERLVKLHRLHNADKRAVARELHPPLPDESALELVRGLAAPDTSPSGRAIREEARQRVREAMQSLGEHDREVLALRYLEQMATAEIAAVLGLGEGAVKMRHLRALQRLRESLGLPEDLS
jgi:RNA polymerase sigma-70 factor, ECF subfamily